MKKRSQPESSPLTSEESSTNASPESTKITRAQTTELSQSTQELSFAREEEGEPPREGEVAKESLSNEKDHGSEEEQLGHENDEASRESVHSDVEDLVESSSTVSSSEADDDNADVSTSSDVDSKASPRGEESPSSKPIPTPSTPVSKPKFIFGSAAKTLVTFDALAKKESKADFGMEERGSINGIVSMAGTSLFKKEAARNPGRSKVDVKTGEENEETKFSARAKLFEFDSAEKEWKERGIGTVKVNEDQVTGAARLLMRSEGVFRVLLNMALFRGLRYYAAQDRGVRIVTMVDGRPSQFLVRLRSPEDANALLLEFATYCDDLNDI